MGNEKSGVRDKWLAFCRTQLKKNLVQFYKDNRFNAVFECSAGIHLHREDIVTFMGMLETLNLKIQSVHEDLKDPRVFSMVQAFAVTYVKVTGPYWDMCTSQQINYLTLGQYIQPLANSVEHWLVFPEDILKMDDKPVFCEFPPNADSPL